ncbi:MAG TPA: glycosyltransferase family 2 protein [Gaiellaceae bacterium]|nr:glycosyltransferase family 2 protein [Gaiellaceae bacterium]
MSAPPVPDVSIVVVAYDVRDEVLACLESIERHAPPVTVEVFLVDNGSEDGTAEAVAGAFPWVELVRLPRNVGVAARNEGLRRARGRMRMFLDSDAKLTPGALAELVSFLDASPRVGLVGPRLVYEDGSLQLSARRYPPVFLPLMRRPPLERFLGDSERVRRHLMEDDPHDRTRDVEYVLGACQLFTERAQAAAGEVEEIFFGPDDVDWCLRIRTAGLAVVYHPAATVVHAYRRTSARHPFSTVAFRQLAAFARFQWKWRRQRARLLRDGRQLDERAREAK